MCAPLTILAAIGLVLIGAAYGQTPAGQPGVITGGSESVTINGQPAARQGDATTGGALT